MKDPFKYAVISMFLKGYVPYVFLLDAIIVYDVDAEEGYKKAIDVDGHLVLTMDDLLKLKPNNI